MKPSYKKPKQTNTAGKRTIGNMEREQKCFCLLKAWQSVFQGLASLLLSTQVASPEKLMEKGVFSGRSDLNQSLDHYTWRWKKVKYNSALWWQPLRGEPLHFTCLKSMFLQSNFLYRVTTNNHLHFTSPAGDGQGVHSHHLHSSWSDRRGGVLLAGRGVGGALGLWDRVTAAGLAVGGGVPLGGRELAVAEGVADEHPLVGQVGHLAVHHALLGRVLLQRVFQLSGFLVLV